MEREELTNRAQEFEQSNLSNCLNESEEPFEIKQQSEISFETKMTEGSKNKVAPAAIDLFI